MKDILINNQIYVPDRLLAELDVISKSPLTVLIAPSGSGKTVSVQEYLKKNILMPAKVYWYIAFGESLKTIWKRLCSTLAKIDARTANALSSLDSPVRESLSEIAEIMQGIQCQTPTFFIIDNYQTIQNGAPYELLLALSQHGNNNLHIIVLTQYLNENSAHLSAPNIAKLDANQFLFNESEIRAYSKLYGFILTKKEIREIMDHTSGWVAAIQLQLLHYKLIGNIGKNHDIDRLLYSVVWEPLSRDERMFLAPLSLLPMTNTGQATIMLENSDTDHMIKFLNNFVFISFDTDSQSYILHNLLREFLQERFKEFGADDKKLYYRRAGEAELLIREIFSSIRFFSLSGNYDAALSVPIRNNDLAGVESNLIETELENIMTECPHEKLAKNPKFFLVFAFELYVRGKKDGFEACRSVVLEAIRLCENNNSGNARKIRGEYHFLSSLSAFNNIVKMSEFYKLAFNDLKGPSEIFDFNNSWTPASPSVLYLYWRDIGGLSNNISLLEKHLPIYYALTGGHGMGGPSLMQAEAALNSGKLSVAEALCHKAIYLASSKKQDSVCLSSEFTLARIAILRGNAEEYGSYISGIRNRLRSGNENSLHLSYDLCQAWLPLCLGATNNFPSWLMDETSIHERVYGQNASFAMLIYVKILLVTNNFNKLFGITEVLLEKAESVPIQLARVYYYIYIACAKTMTGKQTEAKKYLFKALNIALPDQVYLPFAEHWQWLANLLPELKSDLSDQQGLERVISLCAKQKNGVIRIRKAMDNTKNNLTAREIEIAQLVKQGKTNKEIAEILFVTPETVKMALKKIFQKLDIRSRFQL